MLRLDVWAIPSLPQMTQLKHLIICRRAGETDGHSDDSMSSMLTCLQHLAELETLDLKLLSSKGQVRTLAILCSARSLISSPAIFMHRLLAAIIVQCWELLRDKGECSSIISSNDSGEA